MRKGSKIKQAIDHQAYVLASDGQFELHDEQTKKNLNKGDGAEITKTRFVTITALTNCEVVLIDAAEQ